jgi:hypothetical protein
MRLANPLLRLILSFGATLAFAAVLILPSYSSQFSAQARPLFQGVATPLLDPALNEDDTLPGNTVVYTVDLENVGGSPGTFNVTVEPFGTTIPGAQASLSTPGPFDLSGGQSVRLSIFVTIPANATAGQIDNRRVVATVAGTTRSATALLVTTVIAATPTQGATATPTGTAGPTATPGPLCRDRFEPDDSLGQAREIRPDEPQDRRAICPAGDEDWMFFGGISGKVHTIDIAQMTEGLDLTLSLYDEAGNLLAFNDDFPRSEDEADQQNIRPRIQSFRIPANGRYYIKVRDNSARGGTNLSYTIELQSESYGPTPTLIPELCKDLFEPDGVPEEARLITIRERQTERRLCPAGDADWARFFAKTTERYVLRVDSSESSAGADPVLVLVDRDGATILAFNDDSDGTLDPRIEFQPVVDGFYFVQVKNVGDIGNQFIGYDLIFEPLGAAAVPTPEPDESPTATQEPDGSPTITPDGTGTPTATFEGTPDGTGTPPSGTGTPTATGNGYDQSIDGVKGAPAFVNGPSKAFVDPALERVWSRTDRVIAERKADRSWMWGPSGLVARAEVYTEAKGGARQVQYFDKARMEITDWGRDRNNPWFVTNGLLVKELIEGQLQIGDGDYVARSAAAINVAGDDDSTTGPTYASFGAHLGRAENRSGQIATATLNRDGSTGSAPERAAATLVHYVDETGHNVPQVFWDFLHARGPINDGRENDVLVDWVFAMGYPVTEPFWTTVKVGGVERDVLVQAFQRRVLTYTPSNPDGWQVEMGNVGRHYYQWRYNAQP